MKKISTLILVAVVSLAAKGDVLVDSLTSGSTASYTKTIVLSQNNDGPMTFTSTGSGLQVSRVFGGGSAAQQDLLLTTYSLGVGNTLEVSIAGLGTSGGVNADFGIAIGSQLSPWNLSWGGSGTTTTRSNYLAVYVKPGSSQVGTIGFNGTTQLFSTINSPGAPAFLTITGLWITEVAANQFITGYTTASGNTEVTLVNEQFTGVNIDQTVGFFADLRGSLTSPATLYNLTVVPEPSSIALCGIGALGLVAGLRRKK